jgi:hypothetical protein
MFSRNSHETQAMQNWLIKATNGSKFRKNLSEAKLEIVPVPVLGKNTYM